jgi:hypothetical protein
MKILTRLFRAIFPLVSAPVARFSSINAARELGAQLVNAGNRVVIQPSDSGFLVSRVF